MSSEKRILCEGKFLQLVAEGHWEYAHRYNVVGAVAIAAVTPEGNYLVIEQFRIPVGQTVLEIPAGIVGDTPEDRADDFLATARRELLEETGYEADYWRLAAVCPSSPGICSELIHLFVARSLSKTGAGGGVEHERITLHEVPLASARAWLDERSRDGALIDPKVFAGLALLAD